MRTWFTNLWTDEATFAEAMRTLLRWGGSAVGILMQLGVIPTGFDGGGEKIGMPLAFAAALLSSRTAGSIKTIAKE